MSELLIASGISKSYADHQALKNVSLSIPEGSIFGLLGPNGAGKTSFIRIINQITAPDTGSIQFAGEPLNPKHIERIGYMPEERGLYKKMTVGEQAMYLARLKGMGKAEAKQRLKHWFEKFEIGDWWNKKIEELSKGMAQKVQFIVTVLHQPQLLIFDEPFSGFDPINANLIKEEILSLSEQGCTIIFSTHRMESVEELCNHIALINRSEKILEGPLQEIRDQYRSHCFELELRNFQGELETHLGQDFTLKSFHNDRALIADDKRLGSKVLLEKIINHVEISSFKEQIPSVNDIFIQTVNQKQEA